MNVCLDIDLRYMEKLQFTVGVNPFKLAGLMTLLLHILITTTWFSRQAQTLLKTLNLTSLEACNQSQ